MTKANQVYFRFNFMKTADKEIKVTYHVTFDKCGWMRYISHLDLLRLFTRALRRADFTLYLTKGFNPHPITRVKNALKLGLIGEGQQAEFVLTERIDPDEFKQGLTRQLPAGIAIKEVRI